MLIRLTPEQIASNWQFLKTCIVQDAPLQRLNPHQDNNMLTALLMDDMQCWVEAGMREEHGETKTDIQVVVITQIVEDSLSDVKSLLIYSLYGLNGPFAFNAWKQGILILVRFARSCGCTRLMAYTGNESIITFVNRLGADTSQRIVILPFGGLA